MLSRKQVAHTSVLDPPLQPRRAFHGNFALCLKRLPDQLPCRYEVNAVALPYLRNKRPGRQDCRQQFLRRYKTTLRNKTADHHSIRHSPLFFQLSLLRVDGLV